MPKQNFGEVRIISGKWRSRKLRFPAETGLRPTADRVRETVFNWLQPIITHANCLDLFAGSGALGLEALSRAARFVAFVDNNPAITHYLQQQLNLLNCDPEHYGLFTHTVPSALLAQQLQQHAPFDVVFIDPPFHKNLLSTCIDWLVTAQLLAPQAYLHLEAEIDLPTLKLPANWQILHHKKTQQVNYWLINVG